MRLSLALALVLAGCALTPARPPALPALQLSPSLLPPAAYVQQLRFQRGEQHAQFDVLLEIDAAQLQLVALAGQRQAFRLHWDGRELHTEQADWLPPDFDAQRVLTDLQLTLWPLSALQQALPAGWSLREGDGTRELYHHQQLRCRIETRESGWRIEHYPAGYRLSILSQAAEAAA